MSCIGIDCRFAVSPTGLGTYTRNITAGLTRELKDHHLVLFTGENDPPWLENVHGSPTIIPLSATHYSFAEQIIFPLRLRQSSIDLFFSPHFNVPLLCPVPFVTTIHDLILHRYPNSASALRRAAYRLVIGHAVRRARSIIAVSDFTAGEISDIYGASVKSRMSTVPEGVDPSFRKLPNAESSDVLRRYGIEPGFFLYVGNAKQHKNVQMLIDAHEKVSDAPELLLVTAGSESQRLRLGTSARVLSGIPHADLAAFYSAARSFVTASLYEGFCLPLLEARACGCPVIAARTSAIPEIAGPGALLVPPTVDAFTNALRNPPRESKVPEDRYNWENAAHATAAILRDALYG